MCSDGVENGGVENGPESGPFCDELVICGIDDWVSMQSIVAPPKDGSGLLIPVVGMIRRKTL